MSATPGAFNKLLRAIQVIENSHCKIYTNTVISKLNLKYLVDITNFIQQYKPEIIQFSMMHLAVPNELSTGLYEAIRAIRELQYIVDLNILRTEGIPYCLMYGMESCVGETFWPEKLDLFNYENNYMTDFK